MKRWFTMKLATDDNDTGEIMIYDMIGKDPWTGEGMSATDFDAELKALGPVKNINLRINSPGGYVSDGIAIHTMLSNHPAEVTASVDGIAASAASLILMAADKIVMPKNSFLLIHKPATMAWGTDEDLMAAAADLELQGKVFAGTYAERSGQSTDDVLKLMSQDRLMSADEAMQLGYCDTISEPVKMAASFDMKFLPTAARAVMSAAITEAPAADVPAADPVVEEPAAAAVVAPQPAVVEPIAAKADPAIPEYGDADIHATLDLCQLAGVPAKASAFIKAKTPVAKVREQLLSARATAADAGEIDAIPPKTPTTHLDEWKELQARVKAEMGIGAPVGRRKA
jgi:ATP-dependent Clp protease protease subunit